MTESLTQEYRYDNCNRLLQLQTHYLDSCREDETIQYSYDRQGNLLSDEKGAYRERMAANRRIGMMRKACVMKWKRIGFSNM